jgi:hypothetical protein
MQVTAIWKAATGSGQQDMMACILSPRLYSYVAEYASERQQVVSSTGPPASSEMYSDI